MLFRKYILRYPLNCISTQTAFVKIKKLIFEIHDTYNHKLKCQGE